LMDYTSDEVSRVKRWCSGGEMGWGESKLKVD
jgi:hypothetical protein